MLLVIIERENRLARFAESQKSFLFHSLSTVDKLLRNVDRLDEPIATEIQGISIKIYFSVAKRFFVQVNYD